MLHLAIFVGYPGCTLGVEALRKPGDHASGVDGVSKITPMRPFTSRLRPGDHASGLDGVSKITPMRPFISKLRLASMVKLCGI